MNNEKYTRKGYKTGEHALTEEEIKKFLEQVDELDLRVGFKLAIYTGMRRSDFARLKWSDVHFEENKIRFYEQKKGRTHEVNVPSSMMTELRMLKNHSSNNIYLFDGRTDPKYGQGHRSGRSWYSKFQEYLQRAGLRKRPFHALRATCIKLCQKKGWTPEQTASQVGDTIRVIQEHYLTPTRSEMASVAEQKPLF